MRQIKFFNFWLLIALGSAIVIFNSCSKDDDGGTGIKVPKEGVLINGVVWAKYNVDAPGTFAATPESPGMFYQWNSKVGWRHNDPLTPSDGTSTWNSSWNGNGATTWEKANDPCPPGWRMPTQSELESLASSGIIWTTVNGVDGRRFGSDSNTIFLPAAGNRYENDGVLHSVDDAGFYWSNTVFDSYSRSLFFYRNDVLPSYFGYSRSYGMSCRCVTEK